MEEIKMAVKNRIEELKKDKFVVDFISKLSDEQQTKLAEISILGILFTVIEEI
jgi:hypothetical protein